MTKDDLKRFREKLKSGLTNPAADSNCIGFAFALMIESGYENESGMYETAEERLADEFVMLDDSVMDRLFRDIIGSPVFPARPQDSGLALLLLKRELHIRQGTRLGWRYTFPWPKKSLRFPNNRPDELWGPRPGRALPPSSYEDFKAGRIYPPIDELRVIQRFTNAGPAATFSGFISVLAGNDAAGVIQSMDSVEALDLAATAVALTAADASPPKKVHSFNNPVASPGMTNAAQLPANPHLTASALAEAANVQAELAEVIKSGGPSGGKKAIMAMKIQIPGYRGRSVILRARSGKTDPTLRDQKVPHAVNPGTNRTLDPCYICRTEQQREAVKDEKGITRSVDAEVKGLEEVVTGLPPKPRGTIWITSSLPICASCTTVIYQFLGTYPGIRIHVFAPTTTVPEIRFAPEGPPIRVPLVPPVQRAGGPLMREADAVAGDADRRANSK